MRTLRTTLLAAFLISLMAVPVAMAARSAGPGGMAQMPGMQLQSGQAQAGQAQGTQAPGGQGLQSLLGGGRGGRFAPVGGVPTFRLACAASHMGPDDPIVYPNQPGKSHHHTFVGNTSTDAASTATSLLAADTTCNDRADLSAYWMPSLLVNNQPVQPTDAHIYYRNVSSGQVTAFPAGFRMIAGNAMSMTAQSLNVTAWTCGPQSGIAPTSTLPTCPDATTNGLRLRVTFPSCWDGTSLDSADHKSHMAYPVAGVCDSTHPVATPQITIVYHYPSAGGTGVALASGGSFSGHADFMNAWRPGTLERLVNRWLNGGGGQGPQGQGGQQGQGFGGPLDPNQQGQGQGLGQGRARGGQGGFGGPRQGGFGGPQQGQGGFGAGPGGQGLQGQGQGRGPAGPPQGNQA